jgi:hypothetical protein
MAVSEAILQEQVANYLRLQYPQVVFHSDTGSITRLTPRQGARRKRQNGGRRAWPDMFIAEPVPRCVDGGWDYEYHGLFIELKKEGTRLKKKDGKWASEHIAEQAEMLEILEFRGYKAVFCVGFEEAKKVIDEYLGRSGIL